MDVLSNQEAVVVLPVEVQKFVDASPSDADYLSFNEAGHMLLPQSVRIDLGDGHDYGRCTLATNPKLAYDETIEVLDENGEVVRTGEWLYEVTVPTRNQRKVAAGTVTLVDRATMTSVTKEVTKNETRVMVVATMATPVRGSDMLPFPIEEISRQMAVRKASDRQSGKLKPVGKGKTVKAADGSTTDSHFLSFDTGEIFRWGNPEPELIVPETPQRDAIMASFAQTFADEAPSEESLHAFMVEHKLA